jgi:hypothetical protein
VSLFGLFFLFSILPDAISIEHSIVPDFGLIVVFKLPVNVAGSVALKMHDFVPRCTLERALSPWMKHTPRHIMIYHMPINTKHMMV